MCLNNPARPFILRDLTASCPLADYLSETESLLTGNVKYVLG